MSFEFGGHDFKGLRRSVIPTVAQDCGFNAAIAKSKKNLRRQKMKSRLQVVAGSIRKFNM